MPINRCLPHYFLPVNGSLLDVVDTFNEWKISAFVTPGLTKYLLMHRNEHREGINAFFRDVHQYYVQARTSRTILVYAG